MRPLDFIERVGWTAIQASAAATITALAMDISWEEGLTFVGVAAAVAACKVITAQNIGSNRDGSAFPGGVEREGGTK